MKKFFITSLSIIMSIILILGCSENMSLPDNGGNRGGINTDPNKYVQISPDWTFDQLGLVDPVDVFSSKDGRLYFAENTENRIRVIRPSGEIETGVYNTLNNLIIDSLAVNPTSVCLDARFNVYFANDSNVIYFWPQFSATVGIAGIITQRYYDVSGNSVLMDPLTGLAGGYSPIQNSEIIDSTQTELIDSLMNPRVFYDPQSDLNRNGLVNTETGEVLINGNPIYASQNKSFVAIAPATTSELAIYAADAINNYMLKINLIPTVLVRLMNGQNVWHYVGVLEDFIATPGTGAGTVSQPISMVSDNAGNVYYTQTGDFFSVHKLNSSGYTSDFLVGIDDIMGLGEYGYARDIAVASDNSIFVLDTLDHDVKMYSVDGQFIKSVVVREEWLKISDSTYYGDSLVVKDTLVLQQYPDLLNNPLALTFYDEVLYTVDNGNKRILRFTKVDDVVIEDPDRED
ncbi:MAG: hypothetical protein U9O95_08030 [Candidatus Marinimicrobia bacterium]|nr:hypothetical protein [Candidatus Neomarinimicrobiota bacterium]